jgi:hypothetical protein
MKKYLTGKKIILVVIMILITFFILLFSNNNQSLNSYSFNNYNFELASRYVINELPLIKNDKSVFDLKIKDIQLGMNILVKIFTNDVGPEVGIPRPQIEPIRISGNTLYPLLEYDQKEINISFYVEQEEILEEYLKPTGEPPFIIPPKYDTQNGSYFYWKPRVLGFDSSIITLSISRDLIQNETIPLEVIQSLEYVINQLHSAMM